MKKWEKEKMGTKQRIGNEVIDRLGFEKFCSHFSFFRSPLAGFRVLVTTQFHVVVVQWRQRNEQQQQQQQQQIKREARAKLLFG